MARKEKERESANLTISQKQLVIPQLDRQIQKLTKFDTLSITDRADERIPVIEQEIQSLLSKVFGQSTKEYDRYTNEILPLDTAPIDFLNGTSIAEVQGSIKNNIAKGIALLESIKDEFQFDISQGDKGDPGRILKAYNVLELHHRVQAAASDLYKQGFYTKAVEEAVKALNHFVKEKSGRHDLDGAALMQQVFSPNSPILKFNSMTNQSDKDEQQGFMQIFTGVILGIRNPRAHEFIKDDAERALELIAMISLLAKRVDEAVS